MTERLQALLGQFNPDLPLERAATIPASWYTDSEIAKAERERVFSPSWCIVGRSEQVSKPGSYLTAELAGLPILVVRDQEGTLRAFFNVCRHRAAPLLTDACGTATKLRCRYHGWTYDLAGNLRGTPEFDGVADFRRDDNGLRQLDVDVWGPLVAVRAQRGGESLAHYLEPMPDRVAAGLQGLNYAGSRDYVLNCNWKVYCDNYLDGGYHINTVHPSLADMIDYSQYQSETHAWSSVQTSPLTTSSGAVRTGVAQYWFVFPNFMLNMYDGVMDTNRVLPMGADRCKVVFDFYFASDNAEFRENSMQVAHRVQEEDLGICEEVQRGLASGVFQTGRFSVKREAPGYHFHRLLARLLRNGRL